MLYRLHNNLAMGSRSLANGTIQTLDGLAPEAKRRLIEGGAISEINAPPLGNLPGWKRRAELLAAAGISTFEQLWRTPDAEIAAHCKSTLDAVKKWRAELRAWVVIDDKRRC